MSPAQGPDTAVDIEITAGTEASGTGRGPQDGAATPVGGPGRTPEVGGTAVAGAGDGEGAEGGALGGEKGGGRVGGEWEGGGREKGEEHEGKGEGGGFQGASSWSAGCNLAVAVIGASIMGLPTTLRWMGLPLGIALIVGTGALTLVSAACDSYHFTAVLRTTPAVLLQV